MAEAKASRETRPYKPNGDYTKVDGSQRDIADFIFRISAKHLAAIIGAVAAMTATVVWGYFVIYSNVDSMQCDIRQLKDVVIYKQPIRQPDCK